MKNKCQCPETSVMGEEFSSWYSEEEKIGMNHKPNECECINELKLYQRGDKRLWLCSCCVLSGDKEIKFIEEKI